MRLRQAKKIAETFFGNALGSDKRRRQSGPKLPAGRLSAAMNRYCKKFPGILGWCTVRIPEHRMRSREDWSANPTQGE